MTFAYRAAASAFGSHVSAHASAEADRMTWRTFPTYGAKPLEPPLVGSRT